LGILVAGEPENIVLEQLRGLRGDVGEIKGEVRTLKTEVQSQRREMATKSDLRSDLHSLRADVASDMLTMQKETREQIVGLRRAVVEYHSAVIGHGVIISELEERVRRLEQHLELPPLERR
jgi:chromosome segregation ATPase